MGEGKAHIVVVPFPDGQGHINPILQFSKRLALKGVKVRILKVLNTHVLSNNNLNQQLMGGSIIVEERPRVGYKGIEPEPLESYMHRLKTSISFHLTNLITQHQNSNSQISCIVYDSLTPWVLDIATRFGVTGASFFTESCAVNALFYHINRGWLEIPTIPQSCAISLPGLPLLHISDFPSLIHNPYQYPAFLASMIDQYSNNPHWMFINTSHALEPQVLKWIQRYVPLKTVGPTVPSILLDKGLKDDQPYGMDLIKSTEENKVMKWLDSKDRNSVVYVSFGSVSKVEEEQMEELAWGLKAANVSFIWVIKEPETPNNLPKNFLEETKGRGMVVKWCSQVQVLAHKSVGCFLTHCGWNSVLEALTSGVPMVAMPQWTDQMTNAKFVEDVWKVGVRVSPNQNGIVGREEIELCIRQVIEGHRSLEMRQNARRWIEAIAQDETSDKNIDDFVTQLTNNPNI